MIDFHTHRIDPDHTSVLVANINTFTNTPPKPHYFCLGIHPWDSKQSKQEELKTLLMKYKDHSQFFGLGEIGLDKIMGPELKLQKSVLRQQIELANSLAINKIILHNVRTYSESLQILLSLNYQGKVLLHDFRKNYEVARQYSNHFETYLGITLKGADNLNPGQIPIQMLMPETDDSDTQIQTVYEKIAQKYSMRPRDISVTSKNSLKSWLD